MAVLATKWLLALSLVLTVPLIMAAARELVEEALVAAMCATDGHSQGEARERPCAAVRTASHGVVDGAGSAERPEGEERSDGVYVAEQAGAEVGARSHGAPSAAEQGAHAGAHGEGPAPHTVRDGARVALSTAVRAGLTGCTVLLVWGVPDFGALVTIAGGVAAAACGFVLPPVVHLRTHGRRLSAAARAAHATIALFGLGVMVISLFFTVADLIAHRSPRR